MLEAECRAAGTLKFFSIPESARSNARTSLRCVRSLRSFTRLLLVIATGGLSIPKMGATAVRIRRCSPIWIEDPKTRPSARAAVFGRRIEKHYCDLAGVSAEVIASTNGQSFREKMLITHRGLSGPAILQISSYWEKGQPVSQLTLRPIAMCWLRASKAKVQRRDLRAICVSRILPQAFCNALAGTARAGDAGAIRNAGANRESDS